MRRYSQISRLFFGLCILLLAGCTFVITPEAAQPNSGAHTRVSDVDLLGVITVPNDTEALGTPVGGLSAIAYDEESAGYYFLSDDRAMFGPTRIYQAAIGLGDGSLDEGDLSWVGMIPLLDATGIPFAPGVLDPEGLVYTGQQFYVSSEGDLSVEPPIAPAIMEFTPGGEFVAALPLPEKFIPQGDGTRGVRNNQGFESLTRTPDGRYLISGVENALVQDGPAATLEAESPARMLKIDLTSDLVATEQVFTTQSYTEQVYIVDAIPVAPRPANGDADNGLAELLALDDSGTLLALERSYAQGVGNTIRLYVAEAQDAPDVSSVEALGTAEIASPVTKALLVDFGELGSELGIAPDNLEGMALGPQLPDGRRVLIVVSDNNFNPSQTTQVWALALTIEDASTATGQ
ncbi:MAG: esterase-like activity of phytase family protein [Caldilineaceae bacterium]|nr:esterase-like activity of phytase family protein [Caldilineaceae bacterium]